MKRAIPYVGSIGLGALVAGLLLRLFEPDRDRIWASLLIAGLVLTVSYLGSHWRQVMSMLGRRGARYGANLALLTVLVAGILAAINYLANRHNKRWDLTAAKQYSLSDQTVKVLENLDRDLQIVVFEQKSRAQAAMDLLEEYRYQSKRVSVEAVDQEAEPSRALKYKTATETTIPFGTIIIDAGDKVERVSVASEPDVTNAIIKVIKEGTKKIYFMEGHGEKSPEESSPQGISLIKTELQESNYEVDTFHPLESMRDGKIVFPEDATALVIAGPQRDYLPAEIDTLRSYLKGGGKAVFLLDPENQGAKPNLLGLMKEFGVELGDNVVIDVSGIGQLFGFGPEVPLVSSYGSHRITDRFGNMGTVYPFVRTVEASDEDVDGVSVTSFLRTSANSWAEEGVKGLASGSVQPDESERKGPLSLAAAVTIEVEPTETPDNAAEESEEAHNGEDSEGEADEEKATEEEEEPETPDGRMVVVGDSDFIVNSLVGASPLANRDLFLNIVNWVAEDEDLISIRPREAEDRRVSMNQQQQKNVGYLSLLIIPGIVLLTGISVWWGRR
ncbi:MAG: GldG family protein [Acidobacteriota bacterium]